MGIWSEVQARLQSMHDNVHAPDVRMYVGDYLLVRLLPWLLRDSTFPDQMGNTQKWPGEQRRSLRSNTTIHESQSYSYSYSYSWRQMKWNTYIEL